MEGGSEFSQEGQIALLERIIEEPSYGAGESQFLRQCSDDPAPEVRALALRALWHYPEPEFIPLLFSAAEGDKDQQVRCQAILTLGRYIYQGWVDEAGGLSTKNLEQVKELLLAIYRSESKPLAERRRAVEALSFLTDEEVLAIIEEAYASPDERMKLSAIFAMGRSGHERWTDILLAEIYNPNSKLQREAIHSVGEAGMTEAGKDLWRLTYSEDREIQLIAIWSLGQSGWDGAFERLDELSLDDTDPEVQEAADAALEEWYIYSDSQAEELFWDGEDSDDPFG